MTNKLHAATFLVMRFPFLAFGLGLVLLGCSSSSPPANSDPCGFANSWAVGYTQQTGTCGPFPTGTIGFSESNGTIVPDLSSAATITGSQFNESTCKATFSFSVPTTLCAASQDTATYTVQTENGGSSITGLLTTSGCNPPADGSTAPDAGSICSGTYAISTL